MTAVAAPLVDLAPPPGRPGRAFPGLDAARAAGATAVVATHVAFQTGRNVRGPLSGTLARFDIGVALFFVVSGFLLFRPYAAAAVGDRARWPRTWDYLRRRGLRILPAYWLAVAACLLLIPSNAGVRGPGVWLRYVSLTQVYSDGLQRHGLTQLWSLCTEVAFYLLLPALAVLVLGRRSAAVGRRPVVALAVVAAGSIGWEVLITHTDLPGTAGQWLPGYLDWFAGGMLLALAQVRLASGIAFRWMRSLADLARSTWTCWGAAVALFAVATSPVAGPRVPDVVPTAWEAVVRNLLYGACAVLVVLPLVLTPQSEGVAAELSRRPVQLLGEISYGIFLWHLLVLETATRVLHEQLFTGSWLVLFALTAVGSLGVATASYLLVERPALRLKDRRLGKRELQRSTSASRQSS